MSMKARSLIFSLIIVLILGTLGYHFIEGRSLFESLYTTALTITTVGVSEPPPLSTAGRVFTLFILFIGFGVAFTVFSHVTASFLRGEMQLLLGRRRMEKGLKRMKDHFIICGFGRIGRIVMEEFAKKGTAFVVIEKDPVHIRDVVEAGQFPYIVGDASDESNLLEAGVERAAGLVAAVATDSENAFIVMTARGLNRKLKIVARAGTASSVSKLKRAGANKVISPYVIGGIHIAQAILNPALVDFMEVATDQGNVEIEMADVEIPKGCHFDGMSLDNPEIKSLGLTFVSIQRGQKNLVFKPDAKTVLEGGDRVIAVGSHSQIQKMIVHAQV